MNCPNIKVGYDRGDDLTVLNWDEIDRWGRLNDPQWAATMRHTAVSEMDKLRLLAGKLLAQKHDLMNRLIEIHKLYGPIGKSE